jgi:hypothetical protein
MFELGARGGVSGRKQPLRARVHPVAAAIGALAVTTAPQLGFPATSWQYKRPVNVYQEQVTSPTQVYLDWTEGCTAVMPRDTGSGTANDPAMHWQDAWGGYDPRWGPVVNTPIQKTGAP